jgi:hypothetical protein
LFGLVFDPAHVSFEKTAPETLQLCGIPRPNAAYASWTFAVANEKDGRYIVLGGLTRNLAVKNAPWIQDWKGELVRLRDKGCDLIDPPREALIYPDAAFIPLDMTTVRDIASDAVRRYARAFGSRDNFVSQLKRQGRFPAGPRLKVLREAVESNPEP